ncbi:MAG: MFS transporter [Planctomycetes bacterium]|nr:MFS transporter [Planctomycetota bacterium]
MPKPAKAPLPPNVRALAAVSFFADVSSEMVYPLLPFFVTTVLGGGAAVLGLIEGAAETTAALVKMVGGWWSDRLPRRKPLVVAGYALAALARPFVAFASTASHVLAVRLTDRTGKGLRTAPRDALLADSVDPAIRGRAFGAHRAADHAGAVVGPLIAIALLRWGGVDYRTVFLLSVIPGALAVLTLVFGVREPPRATASAKRLGAFSALDGTFVRFLGVIALFTLGNSSDAFLLLRASTLGVPVAMAPLLWVVLHVVKSAMSGPGGALSDRVGRKPLIAAGWIAYAAVYSGFAYATSPWQVWALFGAYGVFHGLTEPAEKALVADLVPADRRGAAYGWYNLSLGVAALPASLLFGFLWDAAGPGAAFVTGAAIALAATAMLTTIVRVRPAS